MTVFLFILWGENGTSPTVLVCVCLCVHIVRNTNKAGRTLLHLNT